MVRPGRDYHNSVCLTRRGTGESLTSSEILGARKAFHINNNNNISLVGPYPRGIDGGQESYPLLSRLSQEGQLETESDVRLAKLGRVLNNARKRQMTFKSLSQLQGRVLLSANNPLTITITITIYFQRSVALEEDNCCECNVISGDRDDHGSSGMYQQQES